MQTLIIILVLTTTFAFGQTTEQKALTFLAENIYGQELKNSKGNFTVTVDSSKIWYYPLILGTKSKLKLISGTSSSENRFYKIVHSDKDLFIKTKGAMTIDQLLFVRFDIITKYGNCFSYTVYFDNNEPVKLLRIGIDCSSH